MSAGDPMTAQKWVRSSLRTVSAKLEAAGHSASVPALADRPSKKTPLIKSVLEELVAPDTGWRTLSAGRFTVELLLAVRVVA